MADSRRRQQAARRRRENDRHRKLQGISSPPKATAQNAWQECEKCGHVGPDVLLGRCCECV